MSRIKTFTALAVALGLTASLAYAQGGSSTTTTTTPTTTTTTTKAAPAKTHSTMKHAVVAKIDINTADKEELEKLSGVDEATADKIVAGRPYKSKAQLLSKGIVTKAGYAKISAHVIAKSAK